jgi:hypothetical protein
MTQTPISTPTVSRSIKSRAERGNSVRRVTESFLRLCRGYGNVRDRRDYQRQYPSAHLEAPLLDCPTRRQAAGHFVLAKILISQAQQKPGSQISVVCVARGEDRPIKIARKTALHEFVTDAVCDLEGGVVVGASSRCEDTSTAPNGARSHGED